MSFGGGGGGSSQGGYDPQVGAAAQKNAETAAKSEQFSEDYFNKNVAPLLDKMSNQADTTTKQSQALFDLNYPQAQASAAQNTKYGLPAQENYYKMVQDYSAPGYQDQVAREAMGDVTNSAQNTQQQTNRYLQSIGVDPTSGANVSAQNNNAVMNAAAQASAANKARTAARALGIQLTSDAANFGRGAASNAINFSGAAQGNTNSAFGTTQGAITSANQGAAVPMQGIQTAGQLYSNNLATYGSMNNASISANAQASAAADQGFGSMIGSGLTAAAIAF